MDSNSPSKTSITKLNIQGKSIYIQLFWIDNENTLFHIKVFDGSNSWSGRFSNEFAKSFRKSVDETDDEYKDNVLKGLSGNNNFKHDFVIMQEDRTSAKLSWKKVFDDSIVMIHGTVPVHIDDVTESKDTLIDFLLSENKDLKEVIETYSKRNDTLSNNLDKCKRELEEFVNMKTSLEASLYGKFIQLLNEKKRRIRLLEENIQKFE